jgi:cytoskeletal protein CcmA (bactofilin family)
MMTRRFAIPCFFFLLFSSGALFLHGQTLSVQKDVHVSTDETQENVFVIGGSVFIEGVVRQSVVAVGGSIVISGRVGEDVVGIGSSVTLKSTASVTGDVIALGGSLDREPGSLIAGDTVYFRTSEFSQKVLKDGWLKGAFSLSLFPFLIVVKLMSFILWAFAALAGSALFPRQIVFAAGGIRKSFWPVFVVGLASIVVFTALVLFSALLSILIIGIPILLALIAAGLAVKIFGRLVVFYFLGESFFRAVGAKKISVAAASLAGLVFVTLGGIIPVIGFLLSFVLSVIGWGIVLRTKFGTTENWFHRKPAVDGLSES